MNVLYLTYGLPVPPRSGARLRDLNLLKQLATRHRVTCVCLLEQPQESSDLAALERLGIRVLTFANTRETHTPRFVLLMRHQLARRRLATFDYWNARMFDAVRKLSESEPFDAVQIEHSFLVPYMDALAPALQSHTLLDLHNIGALQYASMAGLPLPARERLVLAVKEQLMKKWEIRAAERFARVVTVSQADAAWLSAQASCLHVEVVENGVDLASHPFLSPGKQDATLLFVGTLGYLPNREGLNWFCADVLPLLVKSCPAVSLQIVGRAPNAKPGAWQTHNVNLAADVNNLEPFYTDASVVVVPLRAGGGTRLKVLEAMAYGRPVVSTRIGCAGLDVRDGDHVLFADTAEEFAARVLYLIQHREERARLARNARALVETRFDWKHVGEKLLKIYDELA